MKKQDRIVDLKHTQMRVLPEEVRRQLLPEAFTYPNLEEQHKLVLMLADHHGVSPEQLCLGSGSGELIDGIISAFGQRIMTFVPTFFLFDFYSKKYNSKVEFVEWAWEDNKLKLDESKVSEQTLIWICNPNNPTGHLVDKDFIYDLAERSKAIIALDENFLVFNEPEANPMAAAKDAPDNIISIMSFSKIYGIPGQRLGYAIGKKSHIKKLNDQFSLFHINALAVKYGKLTLGHWNDYKILIEGVIKRRELIGARLKELGFDLLPLNGSWFSIRFKDVEENERVIKLLAESGIIGIPFYHFEFSYLEKPPCLRFAVPTEEDFIFTLNAFEKLKKQL